MNVPLILVLVLVLPLVILAPSVSRVQNSAANAGSSSSSNDDNDSDRGRRILHEPLFPVTSSPPPPAAEPPPPEDPQSNWPFFPQAPPGPSPDQTDTPPATPTNVSSSIPQASTPAHPIQKIVIALSIVVAVVVTSSTLACFLYRSRIKRPTESSTSKLVSDNTRSQRDRGSANTADLLYLGTVKPSNRRGDQALNGVSSAEPSNRSPYGKLNLCRQSEFYRPSPELQPLSQLVTVPRQHSPPAMSSDEENSFHSAQGSTAAAANSESSYSPASRQLFPATIVRSGGHVANSIQHSHPAASAKLPVAPQLLQLAPPRGSPTPAPLPPLPPVPPATQAQQPQSILPKSVSPLRKVELRKPTSPPNLVLPPLTSNQSKPEEGSDHLKQPQQPPLPPPPGPKYGTSVPPAPPVPPRPPPPLTLKCYASGLPPAPPPPAPPPPPMRANGRTEATSISPIPVKKLSRPQFSILGLKAAKQVEQAADIVDVNEEGSSSKPHTEGDDIDDSKPRLKPLHWDKVRASSDRATVWDQLKSSSFQVNEDMIETLFVCNSSSSVPKEPVRKSVLPHGEREIRVLDPKKSQNIAILLRALNVTQDEVSAALLEGNPEGLGAELFETLVKMAPTKEEELKLRDYNGDISKLGPAEHFLKAILNIPFAFKRVDVMLYRANFETEVNYLRKSFETLEVACQELKKSRLFLKLLEAVLKTGNRMNVGTNRGEAKAFKLDTLLKLADIKGTDGKTTLLHFVVQEIIRSEGSGLGDAPAEHLNNTSTIAKEHEFKRKGLLVVAGLSNELSSVNKAAGMDLDVLNSYVSKLESGLQKIRTVLQHEKSDTQGKFFERMKIFLNEAKNEISQIKDNVEKTLSLVKEITEYFHGNTAKEEAHPFRIFVVVRDFLSMLDQVCKEVRTTQERPMLGSRPFRVATNTSLPVLNRFNVQKEVSS